MAVQWKSKTTSNFSFLKLANIIPQVERIIKEELGEQSAEATKKKIAKGLRPLKPATIESRKKGKYWGKESGDHYKTESKKPLMHTKNLYNSIKWNKKRGVLEMAHYGKYQNDGFVGGRGVVVDGRPFIEGIRPKSLKGRRLRSRIFKKMNSNMKTRKW